MKIMHNNFGQDENFKLYFDFFFKFSRAHPWLITFSNHNLLFVIIQMTFYGAIWNSVLVFAMYIGLKIEAYKIMWHIHSVTLK